MLLLLFAGGGVVPPPALEILPGWIVAADSRRPLVAAAPRPRIAIADPRVNIVRASE